MACRRIVDAPRMALHRFALPVCSTSVIPTHLNTGRHVQIRSNPCRFASTVDFFQKPNIFFRLRKKLGFTEYPKAVYRCAAVFLYEKVDAIPMDEFFKEFELDDTFYSWFLVMELHVWMLLSRASKYDKEGICIKETLANTMWDDVRRRIKLIANLAASDQRETLSTLHDNMTYAVALYDEGIQTNDRRLAEAVWIRLYRGETVNPQHLERLVYYIRKQVLHLDLISKENFALRGRASWIPLKECKP